MIAEDGLRTKRHERAFRVFIQVFIHALSPGFSTARDGFT